MKNQQLSIITLFICAMSFAQTKNFIDQPYLETTAVVDTLVNPDKIFLKIHISEKDSRDKVSLESLESNMISTLEKMEVNLENQLSLINLGSNFKKFFLRNKGILKSKSYKLEVDSASKASEVLIKLEQVGISNINLDRVEYSKIEDLKLQLKSKALVKAKKQAEYMIEPLQQSLGKALYISDGGSNRYYDISDDLEEIVIVGYASERNNSFEASNIQFKKIKVEISVKVKFALQ